MGTEKLLPKTWNSAFKGGGCDDIAARDAERQTAQRDHRSKRGNERLKPTARYQSAIHRAKDTAKRDHKNHHKAERPVFVAGEERGGAVEERQPRTDRKLDTARQDHERHADGQYASNRGLPEDVREIVPGAEIGTVQADTRSENIFDTNGQRGQQYQKQQADHALIATRHRCPGTQPDTQSRRRRSIFRDRRRHFTHRRCFSALQMKSCYNLLCNRTNIRKAIEMKCRRIRRHDQLGVSQTLYFWTISISLAMFYGRAISYGHFR